MAEPIETQTANDTGLSDAVDTLQDEDSLTEALQNEEISFDDDDSDDSKETTTDEAATETEEATEEESDDDVEEADTEEVEAESKDEDAEVEDTATKDVEAERKAHNDEMAKARIGQRKAEQEAETVRKQAEDANIERYLQEAEHDDDLLKQRQLDVREFHLKEQAITLNTQTLRTQVDQAFNSIDLFKTGTPAVQERLLRALDQFEATSVVKDERGRPVEVKGDVYQYLQAEADSIRELLGDGARQQVKQKTQQKQRTMQTPVKTPIKPKVDDDMAAFDAVANGY